MAEPTIEQPGTQPAPRLSARSRHWIRVAVICFVLGVGLLSR